ncbi:hypothetical protein JCM10213_008584 [Rhodosporidiobolus nylandii]
MSPPRSLDTAILSLVQQLLPSEQEQQMRTDAVACLQKLVNRIWPGAQVEVFGSMRSGLYLPDGDVDVVVSHPPLLPYRTSSHLNALERGLISSGFALRHNIQNIKRARVPICKFTSAPAFGSLKFDASFNGHEGVKGAEEQLRLLEELEKNGAGRRKRAERLIVLLKLLLENEGLAEAGTGGLGGMGVFCLAVSFVQLDKRERNEVTPASDLLACLRFYSRDYDPSTTTVSVLNGGALLPRVLAPEKDDPSRFSLQNPLDITLNIAAGCSRTAKIQQAFAAAHSALSAFSPPPNASSSLRAGSSHPSATPSALPSAHFALSSSHMSAKQRTRTASASLATAVRSWTPYAKQADLSGLPAADEPLPPRPKRPSKKEREAGKLRAGLGGSLSARLGSAKQETLGRGFGSGGTRGGGGGRGRGGGFGGGRGRGQYGNRW